MTRSAASSTWRGPGFLLFCGAAILMLSMGIRQTFGLFLSPMSQANGWGRETFAFAIALQNLVWGMVQPLVGVVADRIGAGRVLVGGGLCYALGLVVMAYATTGPALDAGAGLMIGLGLSATSYGVVMGVVGRVVEPHRRSAALGVVGAGGSFGQFIMLPYGQALISAGGWQVALLVFAPSVLLILPLAWALSGRASEGLSVSDSQSVFAALHEAASHRGFWFLTLSFLVCGFQTIFIMIHLPAFLLDRGLSPIAGMTALALIGFFNVIGSYLCGVLGGRYSKKNLLAWIYLLRAAVIGLFVFLPVTPLAAYAFAAIMGLTWLGTVPLTNGLVAQIFGVQYLSTLFSLSFLGHQVGSFLGAWYGGYIFDLTGSYHTAWLFTIGLSLLAAALCWPIDERQLRRAQLAENIA